MSIFASINQQSRGPRYLFTSWLRDILFFFSFLTKQGPVLSIFRNYYLKHVVLLQIKNNITFTYLYPFICVNEYTYKNLLGLMTGGNQTSETTTIFFVLFPISKKSEIFYRCDRRQFRQTYGKFTSCLFCCKIVGGGVYRKKNI